MKADRMILWLSLSISLLCVSLALNGLLFFRIKSSKKHRPQSMELAEFIADLSRGGAGMVSITRVDPNDVFLRSPRERA